MKKFIFVIVTVIIVLFAIELGLKLINKVTGSSDPRLNLAPYKDKDWAADLIHESDESGKMQYREYVGWGRGQYDGEYVNIDENSIRYTWNPELNNDFKTIYTFGGSTMWGSGARDEYTIPSYISKELAAEGNDFKVTNFGEGGYTFTQSIIRLSLLLREEKRPDYVVFYDGVNDVAAAYESGEAGRAVNLFLIEDQIQSGNWGKIKAGLRGILKENCTACQAALNIMRAVTPNAFRAYDLGASGYTEEELKILAEDTKEYYSTSLKFLDMLSKSYDFEYLAFWQPNLFLEPKIIESESGLAAVDPRVEDQKIKELHKFINPLMVTNKEMHFWNISDILNSRENSYYLDHAHLSEEGNEVVAKKIVEVFKNQYLNE